MVQDAYLAFPFEYHYSALILASYPQHLEKLLNASEEQRLSSPGSAEVLGDPDRCVLVLLPLSPEFLSYAVINSNDHPFHPSHLPISINILFWFSAQI